MATNINPFYPAAPAQAGYTTDYDVELSGAARRRMMAQKLQDMALQPTNTQGMAPGARLSFLDPIAQMFQSYAGTKLGERADTEEQKIKAAQTAAVNDWLGSMPKDTPGAPGSPSPPDELGGGPAQPAILPKPPSAQDIMAWGGKGVNLGSAATKIGDMAMQAGLANMLPKDPIMSVGGDIYNRQTGEFTPGPSTTARLKETEVAHRAAETQAAANTQQRAADAAQADATKRQLAQQHNDTLLMLGQMHQQGLAVAPGGYTNDGQRIVTDKQGGQFVVTRDAKGGLVHTPYDGPATPSATVEKEVTKLQGLNASMQVADSLLDVVDKNKNAFSPESRIAGIPLIGPALAGKKYTAAELEAQSKVGTATAQILHQLYGSALSAGEQDRAKKFLPTADDNPITLAAKLKSMREWADSQRSQYSGAAQAIAMGRGGGGGAPAGGDGWGPVQKH